MCYQLKSSSSFLHNRTDHFKLILIENGDKMRFKKYLINNVVKKQNQNLIASVT